MGLYQMLRWLLLEDGPMNGAENMARDEYILKRVMEREGEAILRLYYFKPAAVSVGYHQDPAKILDLDAMKDDRIDLVRRITGGRALLHSEEFTYCLAASPRGNELGDSVGETFTAISGALVEALSGMGVKARLSAGGRSSGAGGRSSPCLVSVSRYEITAEGRKIAGSAQRRSGGSFLQHGSILAGPASGGIARYLPPEYRNISGRVTSIMEETGTKPRFSSFTEAVVGAFEATFGAAFDRIRLTPEELGRVAGIRKDKAAEFQEMMGGVDG